MNTKKNKIVLLFLIMTAGVFFNAYSNGKNTRYILKTKYFDIIYRNPSKATAVMMSQKIDDIYIEIRKSLKVEDFYTFKNFPVYVEYSTQDLNAYYTEYPYRHIVFYDTPPSAYTDLTNFENSVLEVLKHELVHAVSYNVKNGFNNFISELFFNGLSNAIFTVPTSIAEGIAVQQESENGRGRLNDPFATHIIKQAIIENVCPDFTQITGADDRYPYSDIPYMFGGAFTDFVINKYGKDLYRDFLYCLTNKANNYFVTYKKIFKNNIESDFNEFINSIKIPEVTVNPYDTDGITDFNYKIYSKTNCETQCTSFITKEESGTAWISEGSKEVWYCSKNQSRDKNSVIKPEKLFTLTGITKISFSSDGRYLAVSGSVSSFDRKNTVAVYDMKKNSLIYFNKTGYEEACVLSHDGKYYFAALKSESQFSKIEIYSFEENKFSYVKTIELPYGNNAFNLSDAGNHGLACIYREGLKSYISLYYIELDRLTVVKVPDDIYIKNLSCTACNNFITGQNGSVMTFSYALKDSLPRLGFLTLNLNDSHVVRSTIHLMQSDVSGGIYFPTIYFSSKSQKLPSVIYSSHFFRTAKISVIDTDKFEFSKYQVPFEEKENAFAYSSNSTGFESIENVIDKRFNSFDYAFKGIFAPFSTIIISDDAFNITSLGLLGLTWHSDSYQISCGFDPLTMCYGINGALFKYSSTQNAYFYLISNAVYDEEAFKQTYSFSEFVCNIPCFSHSSIQFMGRNSFFYGHPVEFDFNQFFKSRENLKTSTSFSSTEAVVFSTLRKSGNGAHEKKGFYFGPHINYSFYRSVYDDTGEIRADGEGFNLGLTAGLSVSNFIPVDVRAYLFTDILRFASIDCSAVIFSLEVQKGTKNFFIPLYLNRFYLTAGYKGEFFYEKKISMAAFKMDEVCSGLKSGHFDQSVNLGLNVEFTLNTGVLIKLGTIGLGTDVVLYLNEGQNPYIGILPKLSSKLVF
ncbi:MAG: hypothetical protein J6Y36_07880 [Treponema sp.]|nr:hypothetical protein [Treponema sp.]